MASYLSPRQAFLILNGLPRIGPISLNRLLSRFNRDPLQILKATSRQLRQVEGIGEMTADSIRNWEKYFDLKREEELLAKTGSVFVSCEDPEYPSILKEIYDPPIGLYRKGKHFEFLPSVAIVGTRRSTLYGQAMTRKLAAGLSRAGFSIISGMTRGIDTVAHDETLARGGQTAAVLGSGLDIIYPPENLDLTKKMA